MPLKTGYSRAAIGANIGELMKSGRERKQSIAIALDYARKARKKSGKKLPESLKKPK